MDPLNDKRYKQRVVICRLIPIVPVFKKAYAALIAIALVPLPETTWIDLCMKKGLINKWYGAQVGKDSFFQKMHSYESCWDFSSLPMFGYRNAQY